MAANAMGRVLFGDPGTRGSGKRGSEKQIDEATFLGLNASKTS